jgi:hypothetical protein
MHDSKPCLFNDISWSLHLECRLLLLIRIHTLVHLIHASASSYIRIRFRVYPSCFRVANLKLPIQHFSLHRLVYLPGESRLDSQARPDSQAKPIPKTVTPPKKSKRHLTSPRHPRFALGFARLARIGKCSGDSVHLPLFEQKIRPKDSKHIVPEAESASSRHPI